MISRIEREKELTKSGLVDAIKHQYNGIPNNIPNEYFILIADYIDSMSQIDNLNVDYMSLARNLPNILKKVQEQDLGGIYGRTDNDVITMDSSLDYETKKTFFFHELTHILQKRKS